MGLILKCRAMREKIRHYISHRRGTYLEVLHEVVHHAQAFRVVAVLHLEERADLGRLEGNMLFAEANLKLLPPCGVFSRPGGIVLSACKRAAHLPQNLAAFDNVAQLLRHEWTDPH